MRLPIRINLHRTKAISVRPLFWPPPVLDPLFSLETRYLLQCGPRRGAHSFRGISFREFRDGSQSNLALSLHGNGSIFISRRFLSNYYSGGLHL